MWVAVHPFLSSKARKGQRKIKITCEVAQGFIFNIWLDIQANLACTRDSHASSFTVDAEHGLPLAFEKFEANPYREGCNWSFYNLWIDDIDASGGQRLLMNAFLAILLYGFKVWAADLCNWIYRKRLTQD